jgi:C-terminal processing protease CtpA/Prc
MTETADRLRLNYAFQKVEILEGNIGYLKFNKFYLDDEAQATADHALGFVSGTDALIIDLSECVGGSPELVRHLASYFFEDETVLWRIIDRDGESVHDAVSTAGLGPARFKHDFPLYILTGPETASAAELFAYTLRSFGKAKTVGQGTMGVAHLVGALPINEHFVGRFSTYRNANAVTNSNWEGVGLPPDTVAAPEDSLAVAVRLASVLLEQE